MQTRSGLSYPKPKRDAALPAKRKRNDEASYRKRRKIDYLDELPDDVVTVILSKLSSIADSASDLISAMVTCKRLNGLGLRKEVLAKASRKLFAIRAEKWCPQSAGFLNRSAEAGNYEACYILGMIKFYCLQERRVGIYLLSKAAMASHAAALFSLSVIQFNGSGNSKKQKNLDAGLSLSAKSAAFGSIDALRELGHCLQDGYGIPKNTMEGRRLLLIANARELAAAIPTWRPPKKCLIGAAGCPLLSDFGFDVPLLEIHPANRFLIDWFATNWGGQQECDGGMRLCSNTRCGRPETRKNEFRRCSVCTGVNYCSRACQAIHWKYEHNVECAAMARRRNGAAAAAAAAVVR